MLKNSSLANFSVVNSKMKGFCTFKADINSWNKELSIYPITYQRLCWERLLLMRDRQANQFLSAQ
jgi:hypothetical protein